jgi:hypothetical protein
MFREKYNLWSSRFYKKYQCRIQQQQQQKLRLKEAFDHVRIQVSSRSYKNFDRLDFLSFFLLAEICKRIFSNFYLYYLYISVCSL